MWIFNGVTLVPMNGSCPKLEPFLMALLAVTKALQRRYLSSHPRLQRLQEELACSSQRTDKRAGQEERVSSHLAGWCSS